MLEDALGATRRGKGGNGKVGLQKTQDLHIEGINVPREFLRKEKKKKKTGTILWERETEEGFWEARKNQRKKDDMGDS